MRFADLRTIPMNVSDAKRQRGLVDVTEHGAEETLVFLFRDTQPRLRDEMAKRLWRRQ
ncbi:MAG TPA: hypothetical protein VMA74_13460 [Dyella sp.]|uniref:hypothetical protein n=1 Tax=Dyella sp. TaxID=1869338 RepID=UPI002C17A4D6|nr:hypothetical protein [Dyella sp.]HUB90725.1 hypothetical protein [Dyella sp.]